MKNDTHCTIAGAIPVNAANTCPGAPLKMLYLKLHLFVCKGVFLKVFYFKH